MALIVEDGSIVPNANAYIDVAFADSYHADRGRAAWTNLASGVKTAAIIRATDYIDKRFALRFKGRTVVFDQPRQWPRLEVYDRFKRMLARSNTIHINLKQATAEYALRAATIGELAPDPIPFVPAEDFSQATFTRVTEQNQGMIRRISTKVDKIEDTKSYTTPDVQNKASLNRMSDQTLVTMLNIPEYPEADLLLHILLKSSNDRRVVRA